MLPSELHWQRDLAEGSMKGVAFSKRLELLC